MKVIFFTEMPVKPNAGGIERVTDILSESLSKRGYDVSLVSSEEGEEKAYHLMQALAEENDRTVIIFQNITPGVVSLMKRCVQINAVKICVLHNRPFPVYGMERKYKKLLYPVTFKSRILKLLGICMPEVYGYFFSRSEARLYEEASRYSDQIILLSEFYISRFLEKTQGIEESKIKAIPNPTPYYAPSKIPKKKKTILFVGRMVNNQKNITGFIDFWNIFHKQNKGWKAIIAGDGPDLENIKQYADRRKTVNLVFVGNITDMKKLYAESYFICMTSLYEGWPMVLPEAMACGCIPVVMNSFEAVYEIITDGRSGIIVPFDKPDVMTERISDVVTNRVRLAQMTLRTMIESHRFSVQRITNKWIQTLENVSTKK